MHSSERVPKTIEDIVHGVQLQSLSISKVTEAYLRRIERDNDALLAYLTVLTTRAVATARNLDSLSSIDTSLLGRLAGAPISLKDLIDTQFALTTYGSSGYRTSQPTRTALLVERIERAHGIIIGKTNLHEFAFGVTNENRHYGSARNPVDRNRMTGGSSGGSAASVAGMMAAASVGTDTGGSVRIPASLTGIVGYKPSHGLIPVDGVYPLAPTLDHVGPLTHTVYDAALLTEVMSDLPTGHLTAQLRDLKPEATFPLRVGIPKKLIATYASAEVGKWFDRVIASLQQHGIIQTTIDMELNPEEVALHQGNIMGAEAFAAHAHHFDRMVSLYGDDVLDRLVAGRKVAAHEYIESLRFRDSLQKRLAHLFLDVDVILSPTTPVTALPLDTREAVLHDGQILVRQWMTRFTNPWNLSGIPAISLPGGRIDGLPIGLQMAGPFGNDAKLLRVAASLEALCATRRDIL